MKLHSTINAAERRNHAASNLALEDISASKKITSLQNPQVKQLVKLRTRADRDETGLMLVEGYREIKRALDNHYRPYMLFFCPDFFLGKNEPDLLRTCAKAGAEMIACSAPVFQKIAYRDRPEGLLAVFPQIHHRLEDLKFTAQPPLLLVVERIEKPGNLGTMLRSADAAGADAVIVCDPATDLANPNVIRASIGTIFALPTVVCTSAMAIAWLQQRAIKIFAASPHATALYTGVDLRTAAAIVLGSEQYGLSETWLRAATEQVRIPMRGQADSLNVAAAATILLFEARRQRG